MAQRGNIFQSIPVGRIGRTNFNLSHQLTGNFKEGICYPVFCEETIPGDSWRINTFNISKLETLIAPAMQRTNASLLWFKIPKRLCMKNFKKWYSGGKDGNTDVEKPYFTLRSFLDFITTLPSEVKYNADSTRVFVDLFFGPGSVWQMVGLPIPYIPDDLTGTVVYVPPYTINGVTLTQNWSDATLDQKIDLIPFIAYAKLYDEFFMDQTLSESIFIQDEDFPNFNSNWKRRVYYVPLGAHYDLSGSDLNVFEGGEFDFADIIPLFCSFRRAWQKDYYTSAMPTPQRGPEVTLDFFGGQTEVPITADFDDRVSLDGVSFQNSEGGRMGESYATFSDASQQESYMIDETIEPNRVGRINGNLTATVGGTADVSGLSPISIVAFRNLFKLQAFLEKNNIAGGRFIEFILAHWAERVPDFTVQRPVFVRATQIPVIVSEVTATANSEGINSVVGDQAGRAKGQGNLGRCRIYTQEPSIIIGIYCVTPPPSYVTQGIPKKFQRMTRWDEPYSEFQHIGEQAILEKEIFLPWKRSDSTDPESEFGYQQRYSEFKYLPDRVVGEFATSLSYWHQARMFTRAPRLNQDFIENNPSDRIFAVENQNPVIADFWFDINCSRKLSKFSTPKLN